MLELALWLKRNGFRADQVQAFLPSPMATATAMYHSGKNPLHKVTRRSEEVVIPKGLRVRRLHKAFLRYHDANNWPLLREALRRMGRADLIGNGKRHLVPAYQPIGTGRGHEGKRKPGGKRDALPHAAYGAARRAAGEATTRAGPVSRRAQVSRAESEGSALERHLERDPYREASSPDGSRGEEISSINAFHFRSARVVGSPLAATARASMYARTRSCPRL